MRRPKERAEIGERVLSQLRKRGINMENKRLIELVNVSKDYDGDVALNNINLYIRDGEFLTLLGPSGCGKTTLLRLIAGFIMPSSGKIMMDGKELTNVPPYKRRVNTVFQKYALIGCFNRFFALNSAVLPDAAALFRETETGILPRIFSFDCRMFRRSILRTVIAFCRRGRASAVCRALIHIRHETVPAAADEIIPVCKPESFSDERPILWNGELHEGALHCFFLGRNGNINRLHCSRVKSRIEHAGGKSAGSGIKILNLLRTLPARLQVFCKCDCRVQSAARMA